MHSPSRFRAQILDRRRGMISVVGLMFLIVILVAGAGTGWAVITGRLSFGKAQAVRHITEKVKRGPLEISITERGSLDSAANIALVSKVEGSTTIIRIVEEGTTAKQGEVLVELDSSKLRDSETQQRIVVEQAVAALKQAEEKREIQITQNESDKNAADLKLLLAQLDLKQYEEGDYEKEKNDLEGKMTLAQEEWKRAQESYNFNKDIAKKGYVTQSALEAFRISTVQKKFALDVAEASLKVLKTYTWERQIAEKKANATEFEKELERVKRKGSAAMSQADADLSACKLTAEVEKSKLSKLREQIANCSIKAPQDGEVVYANVQQGGRGGGGSEAATIMEGAQVRERQTIINLPDFTKMQVNAKVHESRIGFIREGLRCIVRTDANQGEEFNGIIHSVSSVPLSGNWPNRDLKEYATVVRLTDPVEKVRKLKPGLSAEVQIKVDYIPNCLYVPVQAAITIGARQYAFPVVNGEVTTREIKVGKTNDINLVILEGLKEGEDVVMNPRTVASKDIAKLEDEAKIEDQKLKEDEAKNRKPEPVLPAETPTNGGTGRGGRGGAGREGFAGGPGEGGRQGQGGPGGGGPVGGGPGAGGPGGPGGGPGGPGGGRGGFDPEAMFARNDKDGDGKLTGDEISERMRPNLAEIDTDKDDAVSKEEFMANMAKMRARFGGGPGGGPGGGGPGGPGGGGFGGGPGGPGGGQGAGGQGAGDGEGGGGGRGRRQRGGDGAAAGGGAP